MDLNDRLRKQCREAFPIPREEKISKTIETGKAAYFQQEQDRLLTCWEFLWTQLQYTRKRWWVLQAGLLVLAWQMIPAIEDSSHRMRSMGVLGCLFVVLVIPELWRNRESGSIQVEASCLYCLRQIYAARIALFGMVDVVLLTVFTIILGRMGFTLMEVLTQFLLPVTVTACICFSLLCGKENIRETTSVAACLTWGGAWWLILLKESIYTRIVPAVWLSLFVAALGFLVLAVRRTVCTTNQYWEVELA